MNEKQKRRFRTRLGIIHKKMTIPCRSGHIFVLKTGPGKKNPKNIEKHTKEVRILEFNNASLHSIGCQENFDKSQTSKVI